MTYTGWLLSEADRARLLGEFPPSYKDVIAHHVTLHMGIGELPTQTEGVIVGFIGDHEGVETLIVEIDGETVRPDGRTYHITWSIDKDFRKPVDSNDVIRLHGWKSVWPITVRLIPAIMD